MKIGSADSTSTSEDPTLSVGSHGDAGVVSVVVPTHNRSSLLRLTLRSVLWQRGVRLEVIVVDDGSTDDTMEVVASFGDARVRAIRNEVPERVGAARNRGAAEAGGEWVAFIDDDDLWAPDKLCAQVDAARRSGAAWVYGGAVSVGPSLDIVSGRPPPPPEELVQLVPRYNAIPGGGSNVILRTEEFRLVGGFDLRLRNTEDWEMWIRLARRSMPACVSRPLMAYRLHSGNASLDIEQIFAGAALIEREHGVVVDRGLIHRWVAESCLRMGRKREALTHLLAATARGQAAGVAQDVAEILRRRVGPRAPRRSQSAAERAPHHAWTDPAQSWLDELRRFASAQRG